MRARTLVILVMCFGLAPAYYLAQSSGPVVYVSTTAGDIYSVDAAGVTTLLHHFDFMLTDDITLCADGRLYVAGFTQIGRVKKDGTDAEVIFDQMAFPFEDERGSFYPGGLACDKAGNLITNSRFDGLGVWEIPNITRAPFGGPYETPVLRTDRFSAVGEEIIELRDGGIAVVASGEDRVDRFAPAYGVRTTLIEATGTAPIGLAQSTSGDLFVADLAQVNRYDSSGNFIENLSNFEGQEPFYLDVDLNDRVYVTTSDGLWRIESSASKELLAGIPDARGVVVDRTQALPDRRRYAFSPSAYTGRAQFGNATLEIEFLGSILNPFDLELERRLVAPSDLEAEVGPDTTLVALPGDSGFVTQLSVNDPPSPDMDFSGKVQYRWAFISDAAIDHPMMLIDSRSTADADFSDDMSDFSLVGDSAASRIGVLPTTEFGRLVLASERFSGRRYPCNIEPSQTATPSFRRGATVRIRFRLRPSPDCTGIDDPNANAMLTVVRTEAADAVLQPVTSSQTAENGILFNYSTRFYTYQLRTSNYSAGRHCATVSFHSPEAGAAPFVTCFNITP
jgi:hypothetical protein